MHRDDRHGRLAGFGITIAISLYCRRETGELRHKRDPPSTTASRASMKVTLMIVRENKLLCTPRCPRRAPVKFEILWLEQQGVRALRYRRGLP